MQKLLLCLAIALSLSACQIVYRLPTRQGNVLDQKDLDKLQVGMTRDQVKFVLGTPVAASPFREDRWDYFGYYKSPRGDVSTRTVSLYFDGEKLAKMEGIALAPGSTGLSSPDMETILKQENKDRSDGERSRSPAPSAPAPAPST